MRGCETRINFSSNLHILNLESGGEIERGVESSPENFGLLFEEHEGSGLSHGGRQGQGRSRFLLIDGEDGKWIS